MFERREMPRKATCSTHIRTEEEDATEQDEVDSANKREAIKEPSEERGASMPNKFDKQCHLAVTIVAILATMKKSVEEEASRQLTNSDYDDHGRMFVMRHRENFMSAFTSTSTSSLEDVCFVDSDASNHMTYHQEWF